MVWVALLILAVLIYSIWAIESHIVTISGQIGALGQLLGSIDARAARAEELLEAIATDTMHMPKVNRREEWEEDLIAKHPPGL